MSKSKRNTIDPGTIIKNFGADAVRFFILSDSPPEKDVQWSEQGMQAAHKYIQKFWGLHYELKQNFFSKKNNKKSLDSKINSDINVFTNKIIHKITQNLENFHYNVMIANLHEIYNFFNKIKNEENIDVTNLKENYLKIIKIMSPILPHLTSECLEDLNEEIKITWPNIERKYLDQDEIKIVIQFNGKKRGVVNCKKDINENELIKLARNIQELKKYFLNSEITKSIYVKNKIINFIIK